MKRWMATIVLGTVIASTATAPAQTPNTSPIEREPDGITVALPGGVLKLEVDADDIIRVAYGTDRAFFDHERFATAAKTTLPAHWDAAATDNEVTLTTTKLKVLVNRQTGDIRFEDLAGNLLLAEAPHGRTLDPATVQSEQTHHARQQWLPNPGESLFGLGQHQFGLVNIQGQDLELWQHNTEIAVPFLVSSKGYGILWDNPSFTKFGDPRGYTPIPPDHLFDASGKPGGLTATPYADNAMTKPGSPRRESEIRNADPENPALYKPNKSEKAVVWEGDVQADLAGTYKFQFYANGGTTLWIDGRQVANHWRQNWLPWNDLAIAHFDAGTKHHLKLQWVKDACDYCTLTWKPPLEKDAGNAENTSLWSQVGDGTDYYFVYGGNESGAIDRVIAGYRQLTGKAPMMPKWAFGLWQSRQRYITQQESLDVVKKFRDLHIPFDTIVQDWMYWKQDDWGSHQFDSKRFPDPDQWVKDIHALNAHLMISVWGKFYPTTDNFKAMNDRGYLFPVDAAYKDWVGHGFPYTFYDAFNPGARALFWKSVNERLFSKGVDAWWMDATEPDLLPSPPTLDRQLAHMPTTAKGTGARVLNAYPTLNSEGVYEGQRQAAPDQRVFILTRSGFPGQQHFGTASWSGDISSTWTAMKKQIAAGLGYSISGLPYWTMDCGGFAVPPRFSAKNMSPEATDEWREMNARWFEFATFVPLLRVHGEGPTREMWQFGGPDSDAFHAQLTFDKLRYRMLPYVYSLAGAVTQHDATILRPLVMDFPDDPRPRNLNDQYLFGPAFLVSPVTDYKARTRPVYLPAGIWYDFWTGHAIDGGKEIDAPAPYNALPVHVRAGSIIPFGPELQYALEKPADPLTLYVYTGRDGAFTLYEDDGLSYQYEHGAFSEIPLTWTEAQHTLTVGKRSGAFPHMLTTRTMQIVFVTRDKPVAFGSGENERTVQYHGDALEVSP